MYSRNSFNSNSRSRGNAPRRPQARSFGFGGGGGRATGRYGKKGPIDQHINPLKFVNKAVIVEEADCFVPEHKFQDFCIDERLKRAITAKGYSLPTPIQDKIIPHILAGKDVVGVANTGTGKTAAFLVPLINKVLLNKKEQVIIMAPTRELAIQIDQELKRFARGMGIFSVCCVGGASIGQQMSGLRYQNNFIIGTPGRLKDLINRKALRLANFSNVVLDEADRMLDMGFIGDMRIILAEMSKTRQTLLFSATICSDIEKVIGEFLKSPVRISVKTGDTPQSIDQDVVKVAHGHDKVDVLADLLIQKEFSKVLIFGRTKFGVEKLSKVLIQRGLKAESIHSDKNHSKRQSALNMFRSNRVQILVATDVAARGLDIADISHVISYDLPATFDDIHRIGRTGRGDKRGKALNFIG
ncbi:MAG: DEAD/DEAH box helicase [Candidatus Gribaldobacteria bacterium]|nr:DEAD/DEAH box helicase [Candidatus Gribaldobacteria bacterium]